MVKGFFRTLIDLCLQKFDAETTVNTYLQAVFAITLYLVCIIILDNARSSVWPNLW